MMRAVLLLVALFALGCIGGLILAWLDQGEAGYR